MNELFARSIKYGFHCGGEGGYYDTLVIDGPIFNSRLEVLESHKVMESNCEGHLIVDKLQIVKKVIQEE